MMDAAKVHSGTQSVMGATKMMHDGTQSVMSAVPVHDGTQSVNLSQFSFCQIYFILVSSISNNCSVLGVLDGASPISALGEMHLQ